MNGLGFRFLFSVSLLGVGTAFAQTPTFNFAPPAMPDVPFPPTQSYDVISKKRADLKLPAYTLAQKQLIADQAEYLIESYYVHQEQRRTEYGVDAVSELKATQAVASALSDDELQRRLSSTFNRLHDLHTNYAMPSPLACYRSLLPFSLVEITLPSGLRAFAVDGITKVSEILALSPGANQLAAGDVLERFSGASPESIMQSLEDLGAGGNANALRRRATESMTYRNLSRSTPPVNDAEQLQFLKPDGTRYTLSLPWVIRTDAVCVAMANPSSSKTTRKIPTAPRKLTLERLNQGIDQDQLEFKRLFKTPTKRVAITTLPDEILTTSPESTIHYKMIHRPEGDYGYVLLDSFSPTKKTDDAISVMRSLLTVQFANTRGLVIDLRGNGGGTISYGEGMLQLFTPENIQVEKFQMLTTSANREFIKVQNATAATLSTFDQSVASGKPFTDPEIITTENDSNGLGQFYFKPVIVLTDSSCFSTCDMFTAGMQDNGIAKIISVDLQTGGGGANVMAYSDFSDAFPKTVVSPFKALPGGQTLRAAWRRAIRVGKNAGEVLEGRGVIADETIPTTQMDLIATDSVYLPRLTGELDVMNRESDRADSEVSLNTEARLDYTGGGDLVIPVKVAGTESISLQVNGKEFANLPVNGTSKNLTSTALMIPSSSLSMLSDLSSVDVIGQRRLLTGETIRVWRKVISLRRVPKATESVPFVANFSDPTKLNLHIYEIGTEKWQVLNNTLRVGAGPAYHDNTHTEASLFIQVPASGASVSFTRELHSEKDFDFFKVSAVAGGKETAIVPEESGDVAAAAVKYDLKAFAGQTIEIRFTFDSDPGVTSTGPVISNLSVQ